MSFLTSLFGGSEQKTTTTTTQNTNLTTNNDRRVALQDAINLGDGSSYSTFAQDNSVDLNYQVDGRTFYDDRDYTDDSTTMLVDGRVFSDARAWTDASVNTDARAFTDARAYTDGSIRAYTDGRIDGRIDNSVTTVNSADAEVMKTLAWTVPDAARAVASMGADTLRSMSGAIVDLNRDSLQRNSQSFDSVVGFGASMVDKLINASIQNTKVGNELATVAVQSYQPTDNKNADAIKWAAAAAAGIAVLVLLRGAR